MSEIVLFSPSYKEVYGKMDVEKLGWNIPPIGLSYIASFLEANGHTVRLVDLHNSNEDVEEIMEIENPEWIGISCVNPTVYEAQRISEIGKRVNPKIKVVWGGAAPTVLVNETLSFDCVDFIVIGEGELTILELLNKNKPEDINGIGFKRDGKIKINPPRILIQDLNSLPFPAYDKLPIKRYNTPYFGRTLSVISSRGCPYECAFCAAGIAYGRKYRSRSPQNFVSELQYWNRRFGIRAFYIFDDIFTLDKKNVEEICQEIKDKNLKIKWACESRVDTISRKILVSMKNAGCKYISFGIESGDQKILNIIKKGITLSQIKNAIELTRKVGIETHSSFIIGHPFEDKMSIQNTINLAKSLPLDYAQFSIMTPLPGTGIWEMAKRGEGIKILSGDWKEFKWYGKPIIVLPNVTEKELLAYQRKAYRKFYFRIKYILIRLIKTPLKILKNIKIMFTLLYFMRKE